MAQGRRVRGRDQPGLGPGERRTTVLNPSERNLEALLLALTPSRLCDTVMALAREGGRPEEGVTLQALMDNLCGDLDLGTGREGWAHRWRCI